MGHQSHKSRSQEARHDRHAHAPPPSIRAPETASGAGSTAAACTPGWPPRRRPAARSCCSRTRWTQGKMTPLHTHPESDETMYVLEGEILMHLDGTRAPRRRRRARRRAPRRAPRLPGAPRRRGCCACTRPAAARRSTSAPASPCADDAAAGRSTSTGSGPRRSATAASSCSGRPRSPPRRRYPPRRSSHAPRPRPFDVSLRVVGEPHVGAQPTPRESHHGTRWLLHLH